MKQHIMFRSETPTDGYALTILSAYEIDNELRVLMEVSGGESCQVMGEVNVELDVETQADHDDLPVKFYIVNDRTDRIQNVFKQYGINVAESEMIHTLNSRYDFKPLVANGRLLFSQPKDKIELEVLLTDKPADDVEVSRELLEAVNLDSEVAHRLLQQNPECMAVLKTMYKAGLFTSDKNENYDLFSVLIKGMHSLSEEERGNLVALYNLLASDDKGQCLLTGKIHEIITEDVLGIIPYYRCHAKDYLMLLQDLQPLSLRMIENLFLCSPNSILLHKNIQKFDGKYECEKYLYETISDAKAILTLANYLRIRESDATSNTPYEWMTKDYFKYVVDHIDDADNLISGALLLYKHGLLENHAEQFKSNPRAQVVFQVMVERRILSKDHIVAAIVNPEFPQVLKLFDYINETGCGSSPSDVNIVNDMMITILHNRELTKAACILERIHTQKRMQLYNENKRGVSHQKIDQINTQVKEDLRRLIEASKITPNHKSQARSCSFCSCISSLFASKPLTLEERVEKLEVEFEQLYGNLKRGAM